VVGLVPHIEDIVNRFAKDGFTALAPGPLPWEDDDVA